MEFQNNSVFSFDKGDSALRPRLFCKARRTRAALPASSTYRIMIENCYPWFSFSSILRWSALSIALLSSSRLAQGCYVDGTVSGTSVEGTASAAPLPPLAIQPAVLRTRAGYTYSITSVLGYWYGSRQSVDKVGISRVVQQRAPNNVYGSAVNVAVPAQDGPSQNGLPAGSGTASRQYGPYTPVNQYGVEYIYLNMVDTWGTFQLPEVTHTPIVTNTTPGYAVAVYVYPNNAQAVFYGPGGNALASSYHGNAPKIQVSMANLYPAGVTWVQFYPTNSPGQVTTIPATQATAKSTDLDTRNITVDLSTLILTPGSWTVEVVQRTNTYPDDHIGSATFTVDNNFNINTELGSVK
jgi:hypothetical protein